jgi:hypothetical protein
VSGSSAAGLGAKNINTVAEKWQQRLDRCSCDVANVVEQFVHLDKLDSVVGDTRPRERACNGPRHVAILAVWLSFSCRSPLNTCQRTSEMRVEQILAPAPLELIGVGVFVVVDPGPIVPGPPMRENNCDFALLRATRSCRPQAKVRATRSSPQAPEQRGHPPRFCTKRMVLQTVIIELLQPILYIT